VKFSRESTPSQAVTLDQLLEWEKARRDAVVARGGIPYHRILVTLYDMSEEGKTNHRGVGKGQGETSGRTFTYSYWRHPDGTLSDIQIHEYIEVNHETGETLPWRDL